MGKSCPPDSLGQSQLRVALLVKSPKMAHIQRIERGHLRFLPGEQVQEIMNRSAPSSTRLVVGKGLGKVPLNPRTDQSHRFFINQHQTRSVRYRIDLSGEIRRFSSPMAQTPSAP
jgi:hypothetical protein